jgi:hypothetical protein
MTSAGWGLSRTGRQQALVPASYLSPRPATVKSSFNTRKPTEKPEQAPNRLSERKLLQIYEPKTKEEENLYSVPEEMDSKPVSLHKVKSRFSWCSNDSNLYTCSPPFENSSSLSKSSRPILKFDPVAKDLTIVRNSHTLSPAEAQNIEVFLGELFETTPETEFEKEDEIDRANGTSPQMEVKEGQDEPRSVGITVGSSRVRVIEELNESDLNVTKFNPRNRIRRIHPLCLQSPKIPLKTSKLVSPTKATLAPEGIVSPQLPRESKKQEDDPFNSGYEITEEKLKEVRA